VHLGVLVNSAHYLLVRAIEPFIDVPFATFRVANYAGRSTIVYALYFLPIALFAVLIDRWQAIELVLPRDRIAGADGSSKPSQSVRSNVILDRSLPLVSLVAFLACLIAVIRVPVHGVAG